MDEKTREKLAASLTANTTELLEFLPYLLQDLWELGSSPDDIIELLAKYTGICEAWRVLDLACGKGAVSVKIAEAFGCQVKGIDIIPDFIAFAKQKAREYGVGELCRFETGDVNKAILQNQEFDCVIFGAAGDILGGPGETIEKLKQTVKEGGYIIIDEGYLTDKDDNNSLCYQNYECFALAEWMDFFRETGVRLLGSIQPDPREIKEVNDSNNEALIARANELAQRYPEKQGLFRGYIQSQLDECFDLDNTLIPVTWLLQKQ